MFHFVVAVIRNMVSDVAVGIGAQTSLWVTRAFTTMSKTPEFNQDLHREIYARCYGDPGCGSLSSSLSPEMWKEMSIKISLFNMRMIRASFGAICLCIGLIQALPASIIGATWLWIAGSFAVSAFVASIFLSLCVDCLKPVWFEASNNETQHRCFLRLVNYPVVALFWSFVAGLVAFWSFNGKDLPTFWWTESSRVHSIISVVIFGVRGLAFFAIFAWAFARYWAIFRRKYDQSGGGQSLPDTSDTASAASISVTHLESTYVIAEIETV
ncbi:hypothetical protein D9619_012729 [Psilocybe cf. subviscida]|uniref:Uncharacterized protein n=1 Tax=Psilocybe cf. subviscida TaxID=2480587 RepID=A0A8H5AQP4_9AGAR|nr:hypothetical protein D9619_012729 [Psilocybe cf. subviscida]